MLEDDVKWFVSMCHPCQTRQLRRLHIPPVVPDVPSLFQKAHIDMMLMPTVNKFRYIVQACCALSSWPEWRPPKKENEKTLGDFIFEELLCRWGGVAEIVTDNGPAFIAAAGYLAEKYSIYHVKISPYNSQVNGLVEPKHFDIRESIMKACNNEPLRWLQMFPLAFWADRVAIRQSTSYSPFFMAHGVEAVLPFDIAEATYLLPPLDLPTSTETLIAYRATQLLKCLEDLRDMASCILRAQKISAAQFLEHFATTIQDHDFAIGSLVLVRNSHVEKELNRKTKL